MAPHTPVLKNIQSPLKFTLVSTLHYQGFLQHINLGYNPARPKSQGPATPAAGGSPFTSSSIGSVLQ